MPNKCLNIFNFFVFIAISTIIALFWGKISCNLPIIGDDMFFGLYWNHDNIWGTLFGSESDFHGGKYIGLFLMRFFFVSLPVSLNIHISDFAARYISYISGFLSILVLYSIIYPFSIHSSEKTTLSTSIYFKNSLFKHLLLILLAINVFSGILYEPSAGIFLCNYAYYRYFFSLLFFSFVIIYYLKIFLGKEVSKKEIILACIFCHITTTSIELLPIICIFIIILTLIVKTTLLKQKIKFLSDILPLVIILLTALCLINPISTLVLQSRGISINSLIHNQWISVTVQFAKYFIKTYVIALYWLWITLLLLFLIKIKSVYSKKIKLFVFIFILSVILAFSTLILCGETADGEIYLKHLNVKFLFYMLLLYPVNYLGVLIFEERNQTNIINKIIFIIAIGIYSIIPFCNFKTLSSLNSTALDNKEFLKDNYIAEKLARFYLLRNQTPILPSFKGKFNEWNMLPFNTDFYKIKNKDYEKQCFTDGVFMKIYYKTVYPDTQEYQEKYCIAQNAEEIFKKNGGILTDEELEELNFGKLKNDDFILQNK